MSLLRPALARLPLRPCVRYNSSTPATPSHKPPFNWPLTFLLAGCTGLAAYIYFDRLPEKPSPLDPEKWVDFKLKKIVPYNHNTSKFIFELPDHAASLLPIASCVVVKSSESHPDSLVDAKGKPVIRPYTPISPSNFRGELHFLIKKYDTGKASKYIHSLKEGEKLAIKGPIPTFKYTLNEFEHVGLIGGGSGITPLYQIITHALAAPENKTKFTLLFANVAPRDILLRDELNTLQKRYPDKFKVLYVVDEVPSGENWDGPTGYITPSLISAHLPPPSLGERIKIFICGPPGQVAALAGKKEGPRNQGELLGALKEAGYNASQVHKF